MSVMPRGQTLLVRFSLYEKGTRRKRADQVILSAGRPPSALRLGAQGRNGRRLLRCVPHDVAVGWRQRVPRGRRGGRPRDRTGLIRILLVGDHLIDLARAGLGAMTDDGRGLV